MDKVRLGRALGYGTRHAARTVAAVVEAASASPAAPASTAPQRDAGPPARAARQAATAPIGAAESRAVRHPPADRPAQRRADVRQGLQHLRRSVWGPLAAFSGALWLRVTGLFFGLIAFTVGAGAWRVRGGWLRAFQTPEGTRFWLFAGVAAVFAYFAVSSFVRANLKERRAAMTAARR